MTWGHGASSWLPRLVRALAGKALRWAARHGEPRVSPLAGGRVEKAPPFSRDVVRRALSPVPPPQVRVVPSLVVREMVDPTTGERTPLRDHRMIYASMGWLVRARTRAEAASTVLDLWMQEPHAQEEF